ncbi:cytochrome P450 [Phanerochaete sordida]|uniref:Cytochrome P450 n=1 Tax=Phanerochaete sordida TaxID=48140 RepID=A0A9P3G3A7_9APHY|nr:cytochrome P450 [Phanerochaete sordida]
MSAKVLLLCLAFVFALYRSVVAYQRRRLHSHVPTVGPNNLVLSYLTALRFFLGADTVIKEGYDQYKGRIFKIPQFTGWLFVASGKDLVEELRAADDSMLSTNAAMLEILQSDFTVGTSIRETFYHVNVIKSALNRNLATVLPVVIDELQVAFQEELDTKLAPAEWTTLTVVNIFNRVVCRASNRAFVGLPICRIPEYSQAVEEFAQNIVVSGALLNCIPDVLRPLASFLYNPAPGCQRRAAKYLGAVIEDRKRQIVAHGEDYHGKPADMISWIMDGAPRGRQFSTDNLILRLLLVNSVALHSTSLSFVNVLYNLAAMPAYVTLLLEEIEEHLGKDATRWTKGRFDCCWKLDSFLKESQRLNSLGAVSILKKTMRPYRFSDGTWLPEGVIVTASQSASHTDLDHFTDANIFDGLRFYRARKQSTRAEDYTYGTNSVEFEGAEACKHRLTSISPQFLAFGGGKHACPGRFLAALQLKCMVAHLLLNYEVRMTGGASRPQDVWFGPASMPSHSARVDFRRRQA